MSIAGEWVNKLWYVWIRRYLKHQKVPHELVESVSSLYPEVLAACGSTRAENGVALEKSEVTSIEHLLSSA